MKKSKYLYKSLVSEHHIAYLQTVLQETKHMLVICYYFENGCGTLINNGVRLRVRFKEGNVSIELKQKNFNNEIVREMREPVVPEELTLLFAKKRLSARIATLLEMNEAEEYTLVETTTTLRRFYGVDSFIIITEMAIHDDSKVFYDVEIRGTDGNLQKLLEQLRLPEENKISKLYRITKKSLSV